MLQQLAAGDAMSFAVRGARRLASALILLCGTISCAPLGGAMVTTETIQKEPTSVPEWDIFEIALPATAAGNPFDVRFLATFVSGDTRVQAHGFYDGNGVYRIRFMPRAIGQWRYETSSDLAALSGKSGEFKCVKPSAGSHGPVGVRNVYQFAYADGTPFVPISTTVYGWVNQRSDELQEETLASLKQSPFNRIRMMVLPIRHGKDNAPNYFPFEKNADSTWNYSKFDPRFFQHVEMRLAQLRDMGIEAELILFHNRDTSATGYDRMPADVDDRYLRYVVARFSAYRNVWWNLANEFDSLKFKQDSDWDRLFKIIQDEDPYQHMRSIHQMHRYYDATLPGETYMSVQNGGAVSEFGNPDSFRQGSQKPVIFDEIEYEGNEKTQSWAHLPPEDMVYRFWLGNLAGTYVTHGETYDSAPGVVWISRGGKLMGQSPPRIAFLKSILATAPADGIIPINPQDKTIGIAGKVGEYYLIYFGKSAPTEWTFELPAGRFVRPGTKYHIDVLDTWNMTITPVDQLAVIPPRPITHSHAPEPPEPQTQEAQPQEPTSQESVQKVSPLQIALPGRPYIALRIQRVH
jgi:hypothetical protein